MSWFDDKNDDKKDNDRRHQDNFNGWDNGSYQYCRFCGGNRRFENDRCVVCHNN